MAVPFQSSSTALGFVAPYIHRVPTIPRTLDLWDTRGQICAMQAIHTCFKEFNAPFNPVATERNSWTIQSTLNFKSTSDSLAWRCFVAIGLAFIGHRYVIQDLIRAGALQYGWILDKLRQKIEIQEDPIGYDELSAVSHLSFISVIQTLLSNSVHSNEPFVHSMGLSSLLQRMQPERFQTTRGLALFEFVRYGIVSIALLMAKPTFLASKPWRTTPWIHAKHQKGSMQTLIDLMCDVVPLQVEKHVLDYLPDRTSSFVPQQVQHKIGEHLSQLQSWRCAFELGLQGRLKALNEMEPARLRYASESFPIQFDRPEDLYELANFNMILIYICRFMIADKSASNAINALALEGVWQASSAQQPTASPVTSLVLPIESPVVRAKVAAQEINTLWQCLVAHGLFGLATFYISLPLHVAANFLLSQDDSAASTLVEACREIPDIWVGRAHRRLKN